jgi:hypothetical protein
MKLAMDASELEEMGWWEGLSIQPGESAIVHGRIVTPPWTTQQERACSIVPSTTVRVACVPEQS